MSKENDHGAGYVVGQDALLAFADLLYQKMSSDARFKTHVEYISLIDFAAKLSNLLSNAFDDAWPEIIVDQASIDEHFEDFAGVLLEALESASSAKDPLLASLDMLSAEIKDDERLHTFLDYFQSMASAEEAVEKGGTQGEEALADQEAQSQAEEDAENSTNAGTEVNTKVFEDLVLDPSMIQAANDAWSLFIAIAESREAAGEAIYAALFEGDPGLQSLFTAPRAVQAMRFMNGLASFVQALDEPPKLKLFVESLGFGHLQLDVTVPQAIIFRDAILDLFTVELAEKFSSDAREGWRRLLNYVAGALIYIKTNYAERITLLLTSWKMCNIDKNNETGEDGISDSQEIAEVEKALEIQQKKELGWFGSKKTTNAHGTLDGTHTGGSEGAARGEGPATTMIGSQGVPTTYPEMFLFNAAVMGFGNATWMNEVLACFHSIVTNVSSSQRLQEECDVLSLRIAQVAKGIVKFAEYKSCMLASLCSLLPQNWDRKHEVAWSWLWENVERLILRIHGRPPIWEKSLAKIICVLDANEAMKFEFRKDIYARVFTVAPASQDFFEQSNTYLHAIADNINEGDTGVAGGITVREAATANPSTIDVINRFGGSTSVEIQWPEEDGDDRYGDDRFQRMDQLIQRTLQRVTKGGGGGRVKAGGRSSQQSCSNQSSSNSGSGDSMCGDDEDY